MSDPRLFTLARDLPSRIGASVSMVSSVTKTSREGSTLHIRTPDGKVVLFNLTKQVRVTRSSKVCKGDGFQFSGPLDTYVLAEGVVIGTKAMQCTHLIQESDGAHDIKHHFG